jgi:acetyl-CoA carboxylase biotin carboxyl carrier protein
MAEEKKELDLQQLDKIVSMMVENDLVEVELINGDDKIHLKRPKPARQTFVTAAPPQVMPASQIPAPQQAQPAPEQKTSETQKTDESLIDVQSPIVGTFYAAPSPDSEPFVKVGDRVSPDTVVCIVEAMKVMNEIKAETSGIIAEVVVENGQAVEYGQVLFKVRP